MTELDEISYREIVLDSLPMMMANTMEILIMTVNLHYATDNVMVAGLGLSMILVHSLGGSLLYGFNAGFSTYASRAFGANNRGKFNNYCLQGLLNLLLLLGLLIIFGFFTYRICLWTGQQEDVSASAHSFYVWQLPGLCFFFFGDYLRSFLNSQAIFKPLNYANAVACIFHVVISAILSRPFGFYGIVFSTNLTFLVLLLFIVGTLVKQSKWKFTGEMFRQSNWTEGYKEFFEECFYVALPMLLDLFMFEFMALYVGSYKVIEQTAAHVSFSNVAMITGGIISGYASACMIKAGHLAGMNHPVGLRLLIRRGIITGLTSYFLQYLIVLIFHEPIFRFYTRDQTVIQRMRGILFVYFFYGIFDTLMFVGGNLYKALKYGAWVTKIFTLSYYGVGGTTLFVLSHLMDNKILAVWIGFMAGSQSITLCMWLKSRTISLEKRSEELHEEVRAEEAAVPLQQL